jgi:hypothetical protein
MCAGYQQHEEKKEEWNDAGLVMGKQIGKYKVLLLLVQRHYSSLWFIVTSFKKQVQCLQDIAILLALLFLIEQIIILVSKKEKKSRIL